MTGFIQKEIIRIGKEKGQVTVDDLKMFYSKNIQIEMNKLVIKGHFEKPTDLGTTIVWKFKSE